MRRPSGDQAGNITTPPGAATSRSAPVVSTTRTAEWPPGADCVYVSERPSGDQCGACTAVPGGTLTSVDTLSPPTGCTTSDQPLAAWRTKAKRLPSGDQRGSVEGMPGGVTGCSPVPSMPRV